MPRAKVTQLGLECQTHKLSFLSDEPHGDDVHHQIRCNLEVAGGLFFLERKKSPGKRKKLFFLFAEKENLGKERDAR